MNMMDISNQIYDILKSKNFKKRLESINENYPNLKQESFIRNAILEMYNENCTDDCRAFAEHPRDNGRTDLSIVKKSEKNNPYKIEIKFFFSKDVINGRPRSIKKEFEDKKCNLYVLIVQEFEELKEKDNFDKEWGITSNLLRYQININDEKKFDKLVEDLKIYGEKGKCTDRIIHTVDNPYQVKYTFFFLEGNIV